MRRFFPDGITSTSELVFASFIGRYFKSRGIMVSYDGVDTSVLRGRLHNSTFYPFFRHMDNLNCFGDLDLELGTERVDKLDMLKLYLKDIDTEPLPFTVKNMPLGGVQKEVRIYNLLDFSTSSTDVSNSSFDIAVLNIVANTLVRLEVGELKDVIVMFVTPDRLLENTDQLLNTYTMTFNKKFSSVATFTFKLRKLEITLGYESWYFKGQDLGFLSKDGYLKQDKLDYFAKSYKEGDVVFLYERTKPGTSIEPRKLKSCRLAVIEKATDDSITIGVLNTKLSKAMMEESIKNLPLQAQEFYGTDLIDSISTRPTTFDWLDLGIDYMMSNDFMFEEFFITHVGDYEPIPFQFNIGDKVVSKNIRYVEAIQFVLEDWNVDFDRERFAALHYSDGKLVDRSVYL